MAEITSVIKYEGDNSTIVYKFEKEDFNTLTQLIVHENQEALFFMNGQALDLFGPGRHTLETQNIPLLGKMIKGVTGGVTPFHCEVYFINKTVVMDFNWGLPNRVGVVEKRHGYPFTIGARGTVRMSVSDSRKMLVKLVGTMNGLTLSGQNSLNARSVEDYFRENIVTKVGSRLPDYIDESVDMLQLTTYDERFGKAILEEIRPDFDDFGFDIKNFFLHLDPPPANDPYFRKLIEIQATEGDSEHIAQRRRVLIEEEESKTEKRRREAERELIDAQIAAQKTKLAGFAEAEVMQAQGFNKKDVFELEKQKAWAEGVGNMGANGGGGGGIVGDMAGIGVGMAAAGMLGSQMGGLFGQMNGGQAPAQPQTQAPQQPETPAKKVCPKCGAELPETAKFCFECGEKFETLSENEIICPHCGKKTHKGKFCMECGEPLVKKCPKCGTEVPPNGKFCLECGEKL